jgi:hypothetical protein
VTDVTSQTLRLWRESQGWDVPKMTRELRKAARDTGENVAAHHGLVKMIPHWERGDRLPRERYRLRTNCNQNFNHAAGRDRLPVAERSLALPALDGPRYRPNTLSKSVGLGSA